MELSYIDERIRELEEVSGRLAKSIAAAPPGRLRISHSKGRIQYYRTGLPELCGDGIYLSQEFEDLPQQLAQKSYEERMLKSVEEELKAWRALRRLLPRLKYEDVYDALSEERRLLVTPIHMTEADLRREWEAVKYEPGYYKQDAPIFITDRGERVRSKSEMLIANLLNRLNIPYRYEYPVAINYKGKERIFRPDFLILDAPNRREIFFEHFGMMDEPEYAKQAFQKMKIYEENGLYEGSGMYYSFESLHSPLDTQFFERRLERILMQPFGGVPEQFQTFQI